LHGSQYLRDGSKPRSCESVRNPAAMHARNRWGQHKARLRRRLVPGKAYWSEVFLAGSCRTTRCPLPRRIERVCVSIASPLIQPSPKGRRVGIRIVTFDACSGFTHVTARRIAQPPKAAFVTRLKPGRLIGRTARQLPDQSTTLWVESSSTRLVIRAFGAHC
jgi:hypothetical protein